MMSLEMIDASEAALADGAAKMLLGGGFHAGSRGASGGSSTSWRVWGRGRGKIWGRNQKAATVATSVERRPGRSSSAVERREAGLMLGYRSRRSAGHSRSMSDARYITVCFPSRVCLSSPVSPSERPSATRALPVAAHPVISTDPASSAAPQTAGMVTASQQTGAPSFSSHGSQLLSVQSVQDSRGSRLAGKRAEQVGGHVQLHPWHPTRCASMYCWLTSGRRGATHLWDSLT